MMNLKIKRLNENAVMPTKAHPTDAGFDLTATSRTIDEFGNIVYGTGLAFEIPEGYVGLVFTRSSVFKKNLFLTNAVGVIDSGYRGEVFMKFKMIDPSLISLPVKGAKFERHIYKVGDRIGQLVVMPIPEVELEEADELSYTDRGEGGYGSTGN